MRKNEAKWYDSAKRWQIKIQKDGERRTFFSSTKGTKGKIAAEKAADAWLENAEICWMPILTIFPRAPVKATPINGKIS